LTIYNYVSLEFRHLMKTHLFTENRDCCVQITL